MDRLELDNLLEGLPESEGEILAAARDLEAEDLSETALDLLARALRLGAGDPVRLALSRRLIERGRVMAGLNHLKELEDTEAHLLPACLLRAMASQARRRPEEARVHLDRAALAGLDEEAHARWEAFLFDGAPRPALLHEETGTFFPDAPTDLYDLRGERPHRADEASTNVRLRPIPAYETAAPDEVTTVKTMAEVEREADRDAIADEPTMLKTIAQVELDAVADEPTVLKTIPDPTSSTPEPEPVHDPVRPGEIDRAFEMPRYVTDPAMEEGLVPPPEDLQWNLEEPLAASLMDDDFSPGPTPRKADPDPDPAPALSPSRDPAPAPEPASPKVDLRGYRRQVDSTDVNPAAVPRRSSVRQFTALIRDRALQSPRRAAAIAILTALVVCAAGMTVIYYIVATAQIDDQISTIERAIDADLYSSHLAALRDARQLTEYQLLPAASLESALRVLSAPLPGRSVDRRLQRARDLQAFAEARLTARFGAEIDVQPWPEPTTQLGFAAAGYRLLSEGDLPGALALTEQHLLNPEHRLVLLAVGDILVLAADADRHQRAARTFPENTPAMAFTRARLMASGDPDEANEFLQDVTERMPPHHVGFQLLLAEHADDLEAAEEFLGPLRDPDHPHASPLERAHAWKLRARFLGTDREREAQRSALQEAVNIAPLEHSIVTFLIDVLLEEGELREAQAVLSRTPGTDTRHPYFDLALGRLHLLSGDLSAAADRLEPHSLTELEATVRLAMVRARQHDRDAVIALVDALEEADEEASPVLRAWVSAHRGDAEEALTLLEGLPDDLPPVLATLHAETWLALANFAESRQLFLDHHRRAAELVEELPNTPETRRLRCLLALDSRHEDRSQILCSALSVDRDSPWALEARFRWHLMDGELEAAGEILETFASRGGSTGTLQLMRARHLLTSGEPSEIRELLDELPAQLLGSPEHLAMEGALAMATGRFERARDRFSSAQQGAFFLVPEAIYGEATASLFLGDFDGEEVEAALRSLLRHGEWGPRAWASFAALRRHQGRNRDAIENIGFADRARGGFGSPMEQRELLAERVAIEQARRATGHNLVARQIERFDDLDDSPHWRVEVARARWEAAQRRPNNDAVADAFRKALTLVPHHCGLWEEVDDLEPTSLRRAVFEDMERPEDC